MNVGNIVSEHEVNKGNNSRKFEITINADNKDYILSYLIPKTLLFKNIESVKSPVFQLSLKDQNVKEEAESEYTVQIYDEKKYK